MKLHKSGCYVLVLFGSGEAGKHGSADPRTAGFPELGTLLETARTTNHEDHHTQL